MKNIIGYVMASAALASAQVKYNETDGTFTCSVPDKAYCAGDSLKTDIIIRCNGTKGQPGRCTNNLAGYPPLGVQPALCFQSSPTAGDAACEKNCIVYAPSSSFTLPASICTPYYTATSTSTTSASASDTTTKHSSKTRTTHTTAATSECETTSTTTTYEPTYPPHGHNSTVTVHPTGHPTKPTSPTVPTSPPIPTAGATANNAVGALAVVGFVVACFL